MFFFRRNCLCKLPKLHLYHFADDSTFASEVCNCLFFLMEHSNSFIFKPFTIFYLYFPITNSVAMCRELFLSQSNIKHTHKKWEINNSYHSGAWFEMGKQMFWTKRLFLQEFHTPVIFPFTKPIFFSLAFGGEIGKALRA